MTLAWKREFSVEAARERRNGHLGLEDPALGLAGPLEALVRPTGRPNGLGPCLVALFRGNRAVSDVSAFSGACARWQEHLGEGALRGHRGGPQDSLRTKRLGPPDGHPGGPTDLLLNYSRSPELSWPEW